MAEFWVITYVHRYHILIIAILCVAAVTFMFPQITDECAQARYTTEQCDSLKAATIVSVASLFVGIAILNAYFWVCVFSFYKELKSGVNNTPDLYRTYKA